MKYIIKGTESYNKVRYFRAEENHKNTQFYKRMIDFALQQRFIPEGFCTINPAVGVPEHVEDVIAGYSPHFQIKSNQMKLWIEFNEFIAELDHFDTTHVLVSEHMDLKRVAPIDFIRESGEVLLGGVGVHFEEPYLIAPDMKNLMKSAGKKDQKTKDLLEIVSICYLLFYEASEVHLMEDEDGEDVLMHWDDRIHHKLFVNLIMVAFLKHHLTEKEVNLVFKAFNFDESDSMLKTLEGVKKEQTCLFIFHYVKHLVKHGNKSKSVNYAKSMVTVRKYNL